MKKKKILKSIRTAFKVGDSVTVILHGGKTAVATVESIEDPAILLVKHSKTGKLFKTGRTVAAIRQLNKGG